MGTHINLAVLAGTITSEPILRDLKAGLVVQFDLNTPIDDANISVPVAWHDPTATQQRSLVDGEHVVVIGSVRRRFFRVGGQTQSRTEVIAESVLPSRRKKSVRSAIAAAAAGLTPEDAPPGR